MMFMKKESNHRVQSMDPTGPALIVIKGRESFIGSCHPLAAAEYCPLKIFRSYGYDHVHDFKHLAALLQADGRT